MKSLIVITMAASLFVSGCKSKEGMTPILVAAHDGENEEVARLIEAGADVNQTSKYGWTPLIFAAREGHAEVVELLLENGADTDIKTEKVPSGFMATRGGYFPTTALAESIRNNHMEIAYKLIEEGAEIDSLSVALAGKVGETTLLSMMLEKGADFNRYSGNEFHPSAITESAQTGNLDVVKWLHEQGAEINIVSGRSLPLRSAVQSKEPAVVSYLVEHGADPTLSFGDDGYFHNTILGTAFFLEPETQEESDRIFKIINLLIEHGADVSRKNSSGETFLDRELVKQSNKEKHREKYGDAAIHPDNAEEVKIQDAHDLKLIEFLRNAIHEAVIAE